MREGEDIKPWDPEPYILRRPGVEARMVDEVARMGHLLQMLYRSEHCEQMRGEELLLMVKEIETTTTLLASIQSSCGESCPAFINEYKQALVDPTLTLERLEELEFEALGALVRHRTRTQLSTRVLSSLVRTRPLPACRTLLPRGGTPPSPPHQKEQQRMRRYGPHELRPPRPMRFNTSFEYFLMLRRTRTHVRTREATRALIDPRVCLPCAAARARCRLRRRTRRHRAARARRLAQPRAALPLPRG